MLFLLVQTNCLRALPSPLAAKAAAEEEEEVEDEEDINLLNYCCDHNFNDTKIKKPLRPQSGGGNIIHKRGKWSGPTTKASRSRWQWLPEKFPLNLLTIFASHKLCHTHTHKYTLVETHTHTLSDFYLRRFFTIFT